MLAVRMKEPDVIEKQKLSATDSVKDVRHGKLPPRSCSRTLSAKKRLIDFPGIG